METWEKEVFRYPKCRELREEYKKLLSIKISDTIAQQLIVDNYISIATENKAQIQMLFALAITQWQLGRLSAEIKQVALSGTISSDLGLTTETINQIRMILTSDMPSRKRISFPSWVAKCPWPVGSYLAYRIVSNPCVSTSPFWEQYVLLRIIDVRGTPVSWLAPDVARNEYMLVGLYNWCGDNIPDLSVVNGLQFVPISVEKVNPYLGKKINTIGNALGVESQGLLKQLQGYTELDRIETCCALQWKCSKEVADRNVFTYLGCDPDFDSKTNAFFKTEICDYSFSHSIPFDVTLVKRLTELNVDISIVERLKDDM